jgi:hypothetical protein
MIPTYVEPYPHDPDPRGELRLGWASWDVGYRERSAKWCYHDASGKISRGAPEVAFDVLVDLALLALRQGELTAEQHERLMLAANQPYRERGHG